MKFSVTDVKIRTNADGQEFATLVVSSDELVQRVSEFGNVRFDPLSANVRTSMSPTSAKSFIGKPMNGTITNDEVEPYTLADGRTISTRWTFHPASEPKAVVEPSAPVVEKKKLVK